MSLSRTDRKTLNDIKAQINAGDFDAEALSGQIAGIPSSVAALDRLIDAAAFQVEDIDNADEDDREDFCREAVEAINAALDYRKPTVRKVKTGVVSKGVDFLII